ncbi:MAG TPA: ChbG/HpnK family deacetylase [Hyphomicrobiales bacterium]|jgi:predicted glycoside hydrolase/deacetylase ChbG (UPF0249 family)
MNAARGRSGRRLILNADDYAMDAAVDDAILALAERKIVTAASAMVLSPRWREAAAALSPRPVDIGLHFDLTSPFTTDLYGSRLARLIADSHARRLPDAQLRRAVEAQLDLFEDAVGRPPDFVDGHQHVHQLPGVRTALVEALARRYGRSVGRIGVRICKPRRWRGMKAEVIGALGARRLASLATRRGHAINSDFVGVYDFSGDARLSAEWKRWLATLHGEAPLAMCHVAVTGPAPEDDPIREKRLKEFAWLASNEFQELCAESSVTLSRWPDRKPAPAG